MAISYAARVKVWAMSDTELESLFDKLENESSFDDTDEDREYLELVEGEIDARAENSDIGFSSHTVDHYNDNGLSFFSYAH